MTSMPFWNLTPWTTFGNWFSPFNRRQVFAAAVMSVTDLAAETTRLTLSRHSRPTRRSFPLHIGRQNHPAPLLHLVGDLFSKVAGRPAKSRAAQIGKLRLELRNGDTDVDFPVQFFDGGSGRLKKR